MSEGEDISEQPKSKPRIRVVETEGVSSVSSKETPEPNRKTIGELKEGSPLVIFEDKVYKEAKDHLNIDTSCERGGFFIGYIKNEIAKPSEVEVTGFIPASRGEGTSTSFQFEHDDFINLHRTVDARGQRESSWMAALASSY